MPGIDEWGGDLGWLDEVGWSSEHFSENSQLIFHFSVDGLRRHP
jgi:hypothetical protein